MMDTPLNEIVTKLAIHEERLPVEKLEILMKAHRTSSKNASYKKRSMKLFMKTSVVVCFASFCCPRARYVQHNLSKIAVIIQTRAISVARHKMKSTLLTKLKL